MGKHLWRASPRLAVDENGNCTSPRRRLHLVKTRAYRPPAARAVTKNGDRVASSGRRALITGITGQDGSYLAELLLEMGYSVAGMVRRASTENFERIAHLKDRITLVQADLLDQFSLVSAIAEVEPREIYNLAAQSFVPTSWRQPVLTAEFTGVGVTRLLEAVRSVDPTIRVYQASSSEMFGKVLEVPQTERTPFYPRSPYGVAKAYGHFITVNYRESYDLFAVSGILFNHESPRRGLEFVTRKISDGVARIELGLADELRLGNMDARRDWGFAGDYVRAMWSMLQQDDPSDFVIATGTAHSVADFVNEAFACIGRAPDDYVVTDPKLVRPAEVDHLVGDASRAREILGWEPSVDFPGLVRMMVEADLARLGGKGVHEVGATSVPTT
jgi:GDPmannose 4,6-dehydratase